MNRILTGIRHGIPWSELFYCNTRILSYTTIYHIIHTTQYFIYTYILVTILMMKCVSILAIKLSTVTGLCTKFLTTLTD